MTNILNQLSEQAKKAQLYEQTLKYVQFQLKNGGQDGYVLAINAIDRALEGNRDDKN